MKMIQYCDDPMELHDPMKTRHLVIRTNMYAHELAGMTMFLNSCPKLESLTFDTDTTKPIVVSSLFVYILLMYIYTQYTILRYRLAYIINVICSNAVAEIFAANGSKTVLVQRQNV